MTKRRAKKSLLEPQSVAYDLGSLLPEPYVSQAVRIALNSRGHVPPAPHDFACTHTDLEPLRPAATVNLVRSRQAQTPTPRINVNRPRSLSNPDRPSPTRSKERRQQASLRPEDSTDDRPIRTRGVSEEPVVERRKSDEAVASTSAVHPIRVLPPLSRVQESEPRSVDSPAPESSPSSAAEVASALPILRVTGLAADVKIRDIECWAIKHSLPSRQILGAAITLVPDREARGLISTTAFVTLADHQFALRTRKRRDEPCAGCKPSSMDLVGEEAIVRELFPRSHARLLHPDSEVETGKPELPPEFDEVARAIHIPKRTISERPFATLASLVVHFPWSELKLWNADMVGTMVQILRSALQLISSLSAQDRDDLDSVNCALIFATRNCPALSAEQKAFVEGLSPPAAGFDTPSSSFSSPRTVEWHGSWQPHPGPAFMPLPPHIAPSTHPATPPPDLAPFGPSGPVFRVSGRPYAHLPQKPFYAGDPSLPRSMLPAAPTMAPIASLDSSASWPSVQPASGGRASTSPTVRTARLPSDVTPQRWTPPNGQSVAAWPFPQQPQSQR